MSNEKRMVSLYNGEMNAAKQAKLNPFLLSETEVTHHVKEHENRAEGIALAAEICLGIQVDDFIELCLLCAE